MKKDINNEIIIYQTQDGKTKVDVKLGDENVWLTQAQLVDLFQSSKANISEHIKHIFDEGELSEISVVRNFRTTATDGKVYNTKHYNLDMTIALGYRTKSQIATHFRIWATQVLKEYMVKGFALNDDLLKKAGGGGYWKELLERIRDIRSSERVFYRQILDIYATSIDYNPNAKESQKFFKVVQNKMHFAAHGHTAAEIVYLRADSGKPFMGMSTFSDSKPLKSDSIIAKNYLTEKEIGILNRIVSAYLEFAEIQATNQNPMHMKDWIEKLDDFIKLTGRDLLKDSGKISNLEAENKALKEYSKYKEITKDELSDVEKHFLESMKKTQKKLEE